MLPNLKALLGVHFTDLSFSGRLHRVLQPVLSPRMGVGEEVVGRVELSDLAQRKTLGQAEIRD